MDTDRAQEIAQEIDQALTSLAREVDNARFLLPRSYTDLDGEELKDFLESFNLNKLYLALARVVEATEGAQGIFEEEEIEELKALNAEKFEAMDKALKQIKELEAKGDKEGADRAQAELNKLVVAPLTEFKGKE